MLTDGLKLLLVLALVIANGFFVAVEFALVSVRRTRIETMAAAGRSGAQAVLRALDHIDAMLSATQFGITLASLALGAVGESTLAHMLEPVFHRLLPEKIAAFAAHTIALTIALAVITYLHLVLGEYAPKALAIARAEAISLATARPMELFYKTFKPFIWLINRSGITFLRWFGFHFKPGHHPVYTEEEIRHMINQSAQSGHLEAQEKTLIHNVFDFSDLTAREIMIPRTEVTAIEEGATLDQVVEQFQTTGYSRLPVYQGNFDNVTGVIHNKDILPYLREARVFVLKSVMHQPLFLPDTARLSDVLKQLQQARVHMGIVVDEHGGMEGILTLEDILEEIVGEIQDEHDEAAVDRTRQRASGVYSIEGNMTIREIRRRFDLSLPEGEDYTTVAGFMMTRAGKLLGPAESVEWNDVKFTVERVARRRITRVRLDLQIPEPSQGEQPSLFS
ncbi:MAG: hemolysin family protein [Blastocatellia bacterium]